MNLHGRATGRALLSDADNISTASNLLKSRLAHRKSREEIYKTISALRQKGLTCSEIGRRTGFPRRSVANWLQFETPPDRKRAVLKRSSAWYFEDYLKQSWANGIRSGNVLFSLIEERGYEGRLSNLQRLLAGWRRAENRNKGVPSGITRSLNRSGTRKRGTRYPRSSLPRFASNQEKTHRGTGEKSRRSEGWLAFLHNDAAPRHEIQRHLARSQSRPAICLDQRRDRT